MFQFLIGSLSTVLTVASLSEIFTQDLEDQLEDQVDDGFSSSTQSEKSQRYQKQKQQSNESATEAQLKKLYAISKELDLDKDAMMSIMQSKYNKNSSKELTKAEASDLIEYLEKLQSGEETWYHVAREPGMDEE